MKFIGRYPNGGSRASVVHSLIFLLVLFASESQAQFNYTANSGGITITGYTGPGGAVVVPALINGLPVTDLGPGSFASLTNLSSITILAPVSNIDDNAFNGCTNLDAVYFSGSPPTLGTNVFAGDVQASVYYLSESTGWPATLGGLPTVPSAPQSQFTCVTNGASVAISGYRGVGRMVVIPGILNALPVTSIAASAFSQSSTNITNVIIPGGVTSIGAGAFSDNTGLVAVTFLAGVNSIVKNAFSGCPNLAGAYFLGNAPASGTGVFPIGNVAPTVFYLSGTAGWTATYYGTKAFLLPYRFGIALGGINVTAYTGGAGYVNMPSSICGLPVTGLGDAVYANNNALNCVSVPATVTNLGNYVFANSTNFGTAYFYGNAPASGAAPFANDTNATAYYQTGTTGWSSQFQGVPVVLATAPSSFQYLTNGSNIVLTGWNLNSTSLVTPPFVTSLNYFLFSTYPIYLQQVTILSGNISADLFLACPALTNVTLAPGVTGIGSSAFDGCYALTSISIPSSVGSIGSGAFYGCWHLASVNLPASVTSIGAQAFYDCTNLASVILNNGLASIGSNAFGGDFITNLFVPATVTNLGSDAFQNCTNLNSVFFAGNAPMSDSTVFSGDNAVAYYLAGTSGWSATLGGIPTAPWNPLIQTNDGNFGVQNGQFGFDIAGVSNSIAIVEFSTNLTSGNWIPLQTNTLTGGSCYFSDSQWTNGAARFYRVRSPWNE